MNGLILLGALLLVAAEPASELQRGVALSRQSKFDEARAAFESVADNPKAPAAARAEALLRLGCMGLEFQGLPEDSAKARFARALQLDATASVPGWNPMCQDVWAAAKAEYRPPAPAPRTARPPPPRSDGQVREQLAQEKAERLKLQERLDQVQVEMARLKEQPAASDRPVAAADQETGKQVEQLAATLDELRQELKERDDRILALSLRPEATARAARPFERRLTVPTVILGVLAVGAAGTGVGFGVSAQGSKGAFDATPYQADRVRLASEGTRSMIVADACYGGAVLLAGAAALAFLLQGPPAEEAP